MMILIKLCNLYEIQTNYNFDLTNMPNEKRHNNEGYSVQNICPKT